MPPSIACAPPTRAISSSRRWTLTPPAIRRRPPSTWSTPRASPIRGWSPISTWCTNDPPRVRAVPRRGARGSAKPYHDRRRTPHGTCARTPRPRYLARHRSGPRARPRRPRPLQIPHQLRWLPLRDESEHQRNLRAALPARRNRPGQPHRRLAGIPDSRHHRGLPLSGLLMLASPFFTSGRAAILPSIATREELHTANSLTQTTQWTTLSLGAFLGGAAVTQFGFRLAFVVNSLSFLVSALCISRLFLPGRGFRPPRTSVTESDVVRPWHEYVEGLRYMRSRPLILGIGMIAVGWATGGGAAQILFSIFGEMVFHRGPAGIGTLWGCAGIGLLIGGAIAYKIGPRLSFRNYKRAIVICYICHGGSYIVFSQMRNFAWALFFIALSRTAVAVSSVLNMTQLLRNVADGYRGRVLGARRKSEKSGLIRPPDPAPSSPRTFH